MPIRFSNLMIIKLPQLVYLSLIIKTTTSTRLSFFNKYLNNSKTNLLGCYNRFIFAPCFYPKARVFKIFYKGYLRNLSNERPN